MLQLFSMADMHARLALPGKTVRMSALAMIEEALTHGLHGLPRARGGYYIYVQSLAGGLLEGANAIFEHTQMRHFTRSLPNALKDRHRFVSQQPF
jgi:hypothetical protein